MKTEFLWQLVRLASSTSPFCHIHRDDLNNLVNELKDYEEEFIPIYHEPSM